MKKDGPKTKFSCLISYVTFLKTDAIKQKFTKYNEK